MFKNIRMEHLALMSSEVAEYAQMNVHVDGSES